MNSPHRPYAVMQSVAFFDKELPAPESFEPVLCNGLGADGMSFFWNGPSPKSRLVITVGQLPEPIFMVAHVLRDRPVIVDGKEMYKVECQFIRRVDGRYGWNPEAKAVQLLSLA